ncbi:hypothetical protein LguiB_027281 [Lonicera macranthoides]
MELFKLLFSLFVVMTTTLPLFVTPTTSTKELVHHADQEDKNTISDLYIPETKVPPPLPGRPGRFLAQKPRAALTCDKFPRTAKKNKGFLLKENPSENPKKQTKLGPSPTWSEDNTISQMGNITDDIIQHSSQCPQSGSVQYFVLQQILVCSA